MSGGVHTLPSSLNPSPVSGKLRLPFAVNDIAAHGMSQRGSLAVGGSGVATAAVVDAAAADDNGSGSNPLMTKEPMLGTERQQQLENVRKEEEAYMRAIMCRAILPVVVLVIIIGLVVMLFVINSTPSLHTTGSQSQPILYNCYDPCRASWVDSIPANLSQSASSEFESTWDVWTSLIASATSTVDVLTGSMALPPSSSSSNGSVSSGTATIFSDALLLAASHGVSVRVLLDYSASGSADVEALKRAAGSVTNQNLTVLRLNFSAILGGPLDATFVVVDGKHFYLGSAYVGRDLLSQSRELGLVTRNCSCLAGELHRLFSGYTQLVSGSANASLPWPSEQDAHYNATAPLNLTFAMGGGSSSPGSAAYFTVSLASPYRPPSMSQEADSILAAIATARSEVDIAVASYSPVSDDGSTFWPLIDNAIRAAALRPQIAVRLLVGRPQGILKCNASGDGAAQQQWLRSLASLVGFSDRVQAKLFVVPSTGRMSGALQDDGATSWSNYMVADGVAYVGTSDWTATSFGSAFRMGVVINETAATAGSSSASLGSGLRVQLQAMFNRDWAYARNLTAVDCQP